MIERLLLKLFKVREIPHPDGGLYLRRFFITPRWFPWINVFVHKLYTSDPDRVMHDHPWDFWTFPLSGYREYVPSFIGTSSHTRINTANRHSWHYRRAIYVHRIFELFETPTWTIVVTKKARREWGFWVDDYYHPGMQLWTPWREYLNLQDASVPWEDVVQ